MESLVSKFNDLPKAAAKPAPEPATQPDEGAPVKPADKPADAPAAKPEGTKPQPKLFQAHEELKRTHRTLEQERDTLRQKVAELESRRPEGADPKEFENLTQENARLKAELRETAFEKSDEFRSQFIDRRNALYQEAVGEIKGLPVTIKGPVNPDTGEPIVSERAATEADFRRIYFLPPREQDKAIAEMFGASAARVTAHINELRRNDREAQFALQKARQEGDGRQRESQEQLKKTQKTYQDTYQSATKELAAKWPDHFALPASDGDNADAELAKAHQSGYELVDTFLKTGPTMGLEDRAAYSAVIRARAASYPRFVIENQRLKEEVKTLKARIEGDEQGDPGAGGSGKPVKGAVKKPQGIDELSAAFNLAP